LVHHVVRSAEDRLRPVGKLRDTKEHQRKVVGIDTSGGEFRELAIEIGRGERPESTDNAQSKAQRPGHAGCSAGDTSSGAVLSSWTARLCGAIAAVLAVAVATLAMVIKVSETVSTATKSTKAAS